MAVTENVSSCSLSAMWEWSHWSHSGTPPAVSLLDGAADLLVLERNFSGALELCERGLQIITAEAADTRCEQVKASLCVVGIQALAELERWREVLPWVVQYYRSPQEIPHSVMEMCLLLYSRVKEPRVMVDLSRTWLSERSNRRQPGYTRVAELHVLRVLLPLGLLSEAEDLAKDPGVFAPQQQTLALNAITEYRRRWDQEGDRAKSEVAHDEQAASETERGTGNSKAAILSIARLLYGSLSLAARRICRVPFRRVILAFLLIAVILLRLDPASPISHGPVFRLLLLIREGVSGIFQSSSSPGTKKH
ncbi:peroxisome assembly protein 26 [Spea bombifrons]|uniref:peroxisome assembly protein 26 n=1 Tax=Spea bombifrons TaxID=233779 RepID=UPI00234A7628|nr:peroxisome assembly protein 26 [Spea bombifrons]